MFNTENSQASKLMIIKFGLKYNLYSIIATNNLLFITRILFLDMFE